MSFTIPATVQDALHQHLTIESEYRLRYERRLDRDFNETTRDNRSDAFQRIRVGARYKDKGPWSGFAQYQYAHGEGWTSTKNGSDESSDLLQLYAQRQTKSDKITIGRQKINLGTERLIGSLEWVNRSRSFDAIRFQTALWDVFVGRIAVQNAQPQKLHIGAVSYASKIGASSLIHKQQSTTAGNVNIITLDHSMKQNAGTVELDFEAAVQFGRNLGKDQEAWALHLGATKKLSANAKLMAEWNSASGGGSATKS
ncbi:MAG: alginate export family protein, partial [Armatimonadetes bacterium]|nr:alginate export family protein [Armatimonadota bacterium]